MVRIAHWPVRITHNSKSYGLDKTLSLLTLLGSPHLKLPKVIHVAGTNGKGSIIAMMRAILKSCGLKVSVYTSPHLVRFNERIIINDVEINDEYLFEIIEKCRLIADANKIYPTFFEGTTVAAILAFAQSNSDILLVETGMGGRLDPTNVIENKICTIISSISYDHIEFLGNKLEQIALEKAGIMRKGVPAIISLQEEIVGDKLRSIADVYNVPLIEYEYDFGVEKTERGFKYLSNNLEFDLPSPSLICDHQLVNAATAIAGLLAQDHFKVKEENIREGLTNIKWPGRMQQLKVHYFNKFLPKNFELYMDGAHNSGGAFAIASFARNKDRELYLIVGMTKGRDIASFLEPFRGIAKEICAVRVEFEPKSEQAENIRDAARSLSINSEAYHSVEDAILHLSKVTSEKAIILICGSLYLVGDLLANY